MLNNGDQELTLWRNGWDKVWNRVAEDADGEEPAEAGRNSQASSVLAQGQMCLGSVGVELSLLLEGVCVLTSSLHS